MTLTRLIMQREYGKLVAIITGYMPVKAAFFFNVIIIQTFFGLANELILLSGLLKGAIHWVRAQLTPTARRMAEVREVEGFFLGKKYAKGIGIIYLLAMPFALLSPLVLVASSLFYLFSYWIYRSILIYSGRVEAESGGIYWTRTANLMMSGALIMQVFIGLQLITWKGYTQAALMVPVLFSSFLAIGWMNRTFSRQIYNTALSIERSEALERFLGRIQGIRQDMLNDSEANELESSQIFYDRIPFDFGCTPAAMATINAGSAGGAVITTPGQPEESSSVSSPESFKATSSTPHSKNPLISYENPLYLQCINQFYLPPDFFHSVRQSVLAKKR